MRLGRRWALVNALENERSCSVFRRAGRAELLLEEEEAEAAGSWTWRGQLPGGDVQLQYLARRRRSGSGRGELVPGGREGDPAGELERWRRGPCDPRERDHERGRRNEMGKRKEREGRGTAEHWPGRRGSARAASCSRTSSGVERNHGRRGLAGVAGSTSWTLDLYPRVQMDGSGGWVVAGRGGRLVAVVGSMWTPRRIWTGGGGGRREMGQLP